MNDFLYELVIVGAGPAGISLAVEAIHSGIPHQKIMIIEKAKEHSWSIRKFYPDKKLVTANFKGKEAICNGVMCIPDLSKHETLSYLDKSISDNQLEVHYSEMVTKIDKKEDETFYIESNKNVYHSKICVIAIGMFGKPNRPSYKIDPSIKNNVSFDVTSKEIHHSDILIVGGGDSASEYVQYLVQQENSLHLSYRQKEFNRMNSINKKSLLMLAKNEQVNLILESNIVEIKKDASEKVRVIFQEEEKEDLIVDNIVYALGGSTPTNFLKILNINFVGGNPTIEEGFETSVRGLFLVGDLSAGKKGGSIISAFNSSSDAMKKICENYLECKLY